MSYILEALRKADQERGIGAVPNLATPQEVERPQPRSFRWPWIIATLLIANAALLVILLKDRNAEVAVTAQPAREQQAPKINDHSAHAVEESSELTLREAATPEQAVLPQNAGALSGGGLVMLPEPANLQNSRPVPPPDQSVDGPVDATITASDASNIPSWYELPGDFRNRLQLPRLDLHVYSEEPQKRFILVSLKKYREGEKLESGLMLEEILPDGMVMSYRGERFFVEK